MDIVRKYTHPFEQTRADQALAAALVHDVGHGPFSHAFEDVGRRLGLKLADHELVSETLIRDGEIAREFRELGSGFADDVADIVSGSGSSSIYSAVVSSQFDRIDWIISVVTADGGTELAGIDFDGLFRI